MNNTQEFQKLMDEKTYELFVEWFKNDYNQFSMMLLEDICIHPSNNGKWFNRTFPNLQHSYIKFRNKRFESHAKFYKLLAFTLFKYGNWSNNDRRRKGLKPIRFKQYKKRG